VLIKVAIDSILEELTPACSKTSTVHQTSTGTHHPFSIAMGLMVEIKVSAPNLASSKEKK
jgi:hypothetical protein